jgi:hypothetical protein
MTATVRVPSCDSLWNAALFAPRRKRDMASLWIRLLHSYLCLPASCWEEVRVPAIINFIFKSLFVLNEYKYSMKCSSIYFLVFHLLSSLLVSGLVFCIYFSLLPRVLLEWIPVWRRGRISPPLALQVVGGDKNVTLGYNWATLFREDINTGTWPSRLGNLTSKTVTCGHEPRGTRIWEWLHWRGPASNVNDRPILSSELMLHKDYDSKC